MCNDSRSGNYSEQDFDGRSQRAANLILLECYQRVEDARCRTECLEKLFAGCALSVGKGSDAAISATKKKLASLLGKKMERRGAARTGAFAQPHRPNQPEQLVCCTGKNFSSISLCESLADLKEYRMLEML